MSSDDRTAVPPESIKAKAEWRRMQAARSVQDKVRILLQLQTQELPLIEKQRPLRVWEKPWPIEP